MVLVHGIEKGDLSQRGVRIVDCDRRGGAVPVRPRRQGCKELGAEMVYVEDVACSSVHLEVHGHL